MINFKTNNAMLSQRPIYNDYVIGKQKKYATLLNIRFSSLIEEKITKQALLL